MRKTLPTLLLALFLVMSVPGISLADPIAQIGDGNTVMKNQWVSQTTMILNSAHALSGSVIALGNSSSTMIVGDSYAIALSGPAMNRSRVRANNRGVTIAVSAPAISTNLPVNSINQIVSQ
jgi:hypothetical protein